MRCYTENNKHQNTDTESGQSRHSWIIAMDCYASWPPSVVRSYETPFIVLPDWGHAQLQGVEKGCARVFGKLLLVSDLVKNPL